MRVVQPRLSPAMVVAIPCDECGAKEATVGIDIKNGQGYGTVRLCGGCLRDALSMLGGGGRVISPSHTPTKGP